MPGDSATVSFRCEWCAKRVDGRKLTGSRACPACGRQDALTPIAFVLDVPVSAAPPTWVSETRNQLVTNEAAVPTDFLVYRYRGGYFFRPESEPEVRVSPLVNGRTYVGNWRGARIGSAAGQAEVLVERSDDGLFVRNETRRESYLNGTTESTRIGKDPIPLTDGDCVFVGRGVPVWVVRGASLNTIDVKIQAVNNDLVEFLAHNPRLMYRLEPRQLEELVAELYARQGFTVELTPPSADGGVDLYVVQHTALGRRLTIVDCKRYREDRPVGVGIVRHLYGTVVDKDASAGVIATTSFFTRGAVEFQAKYPFRLGLQDFFDLERLLRGRTTRRRDA